MAHAFRPRPGGEVACRLESEEKAIISQVAQEVGELIRHDLDLREDAEPVREAAGSADPLERLEAEYASRTPRSPRDSAVSRLFPAASEDPAVAEELRRLGQADLAEQKLEDLGALVRTLDGSGPGSSEISIDEDAVPGWLRGLTDMRLVLADRLQITQDGDFETLQMLQQIGERVPEAQPVEDEDDQVAGSDVVAAVYELLTWLQESLLRAIEDY
ncbi:DUF2017 domain-containing protein [Brachybacterium endophyticum]|uniref:DUF2017 domain-containing protein n=1 Tax=Brachybacterium endophyticum TaxID=2182385 RepID=A0A2U2RHB1_9MICO|nr:DUF2017 family protein [Brachybacterium endophyticum]PWH05259.1 DUF2017 domain-containing protein [Brachybacterium endophyticum]